jgi:hypothetical protein
VKGFADAIVKEIEPLLKDVTESKPFFGGSEKLTLAEVGLCPSFHFYFAPGLRCGPASLEHLEAWNICLCPK